MKKLKTLVSYAIRVWEWLIYFLTKLNLKL